MRSNEHKTSTGKATVRGTRDATNGSDHENFTFWKRSQENQTSWRNWDYESDHFRSHAQNHAE